MPIMLACPGCNTLYSLDERRIGPAGGMMSCKECGTRWKVAPPAATADPAPPDPSSRTVSQAITQAESSGSRPNPVHCPRCGYDFVPGATRGASTTVANPPGADVRHRPAVLVVEDQEYFAELTREALASEFQVTVAGSVARARTLLNDERFDIVILDLSLEDGQDGTQILGATRSRGIPVLVFTARDETEILGSGWDALRAAGATDILIKGMHVGEELQVKVRSLVGVARP